MHDIIRKELNSLYYNRNKYGSKKKLITLSDSSMQTLQHVSEYYSCSSSYIIDLLIKLYIN